MHIPLDFDFGTLKFEFSAPNYIKILIFASKLNFFFYQNLDFVLGLRVNERRVVFVATEGNSAMGTFA